MKTLITSGLYGNSTGVIYDFTRLYPRSAAPNRCDRSVSFLSFGVFEYYCSIQSRKPEYHCEEHHHECGAPAVYYPGDEHIAYGLSAAPHHVVHALVGGL